GWYAIWWMDAATKRSRKRSNETRFFRFHVRQHRYYPCRPTSGSVHDTPRGRPEDHFRRASRPCKLRKSMVYRQWP
ncbi:hypothetical protein H0H93_006223, partial [Arthromyces matolae]